jgi:tetratricopeptide (TPR) repeat protein
VAKSKAHIKSKTGLCHKGKSSPSVPEETGRERQPHRLFLGWRGWCIRLGLATVTIVLFFTLLELSLFLIGFGRPATFFVKTGKQEILTTNEWFVWFYLQQKSSAPHPCLVSAVKPENTIRVFVLGESAAMSTPDPSFGFARILEFMLQRNFPDHRVELVNAAMRGINSHIIVPISLECAGLEPDLFIVYMGNNEVSGLYGPETFLCRHPTFIPVCHRIKQTRVCQLVRAGIKRCLSAFRRKEKIQTMEFFRKHRIALDDPRRKAIYRNYRNNLKRICDNGILSKASVLISNVAVNLRDCPPLASLHRNDLTSQQLQRWESFYREGMEHESRQNQAKAIASYLKAAAIDSHYAELHFRLGRCYLATGDTKSTKEHFSLARDRDALQFRTDSRFNEIVREVAAEFKGKNVYPVDVENALATSNRCRDGIAGDESFYDHVHFRFDADYEVAKAILPTAIRVLQQDRRIVPPAPAGIPSRDECAKRLAFTAWDEINTAAAMVTMTSQPPFTDQLEHAVRQTRAEQAISQANSRVNEKFVNEALQTYQEAIRTNPDDWNLRYNFSTLLYQLKRFPEAAEQMMYVVNTFPDYSSYRILLGHTLAQSGNLDQAIFHYRKVLENDSRNKPAREALDWALKQKRGQ